MNKSLILLHLGGRLAVVLSMLLAVSCGVSRGRTQRSLRQEVADTLERATSQVGSHRSRQVEQHIVEQAIDREIRVATVEGVAAEEAEIVVPLCRLDSLPDGALFAARQGRLSVAARREGDGLVITACSDSIGRIVTCYERTDNLRLSVADSTTRAESDSARCENLVRHTAESTAQSETLEERRTPFGRFRWFVVGLAVGAVGVLLLRGVGRRLWGRVV